VDAVLSSLGPITPRARSTRLREKRVYKNDQRCNRSARRISATVAARGQMDANPSSYAATATAAVDATGNLHVPDDYRTTRSARVRVQRNSCCYASPGIIAAYRKNGRLLEGDRNKVDTLPPRDWPQCYSDYILLADIVLPTPSIVFQDKSHFEFGIVRGNGVNLHWTEVIGSVRGRYFILTRQELDVETAKEWGAVNDIVPADKLLARAHVMKFRNSLPNYLRLHRATRGPL
jgi:hypothetical protein